MRRTFMWSILTLILSAALATSALAQGTATDFVRAKSDDIIRVVNTSADKDARLAGLRTAVASTINFDLLAQRTLSRHWDGLSASQRTTFTATLQELIETSYSTRLGDKMLDPGSYTVQFTDERERRGRTTVSSIVSVDARRHYVDVRLQQSDAGEWQIYDVVTDDISLQESYAESFDEIIRSKGFDELMRRLRTSIDEMKN